jgi:hypothetical protein
VLALEPGQLVPQAGVYNVHRTQNEGRALQRVRGAD